MMGRRPLLTIILLGVIGCSSGNSASKHESTYLWGTTGTDEIFGAEQDKDGSYYFAGFTDSFFAGYVNSGDNDLFLMKTSNEGDILWVYQWGSAEVDMIYDLIILPDGSIAVGGYTMGDLDGNINLGDKDFFISKFNPAGDKIWTKEWGTNDWDMITSMGCNSRGDIYVTGVTSDALPGNNYLGDWDLFLSKLDTDGNLLWTRQWGTEVNDLATDLVVDDAGDLFVTGYVTEAMDGNTHLGHEDIFIGKFSGDGTELWMKQWGTPSYDLGRALALDTEGNVYLVGESKGNLEEYTNLGNDDIFVVKYSSTGVKKWLFQFGTSNYDVSADITVSKKGKVYVTGYTYGTMGSDYFGMEDIFLAEIDQSKNLDFALQWGTERNNRSNSIFINQDDEICISGATENNLNEVENTGIYDGFLICTTPE